MSMCNKPHRCQNIIFAEIICQLYMQWKSHISLELDIRNQCPELKRVEKDGVSFTLFFCSDTEKTYVSCMKILYCWLHAVLVTDTPLRSLLNCLKLKNSMQYRCMTKFENRIYISQKSTVQITSINTLQIEYNMLFQWKYYRTEATFILSLLFTENILCAMRWIKQSSFNH